MNAHQILKQLPAGTRDEIFGYYITKEPKVFLAALDTMAPLRKLRPVFVRKKDQAWQRKWLQESLEMRVGDQTAEHLLQIWLMKAQVSMLTTFLDELGVKHDGNGAVDDLPENLEADKLRNAVNLLLEKFPAPHVAIYLHVFQLQQPNGWPELAEVLKQEPRLQLSAATA